MKDLTNEELIEKYKETYDIEIRNYIIVNNIGLIKNIIKKHYLNYSDLDDLFQEGIIGIIKAIENYDINSKCKFSTYASISIINSIKTYLYKSDSLHNVCTYLREQINKYKYFKSLNLSDEEIQIKMNLNNIQYEKFLKKCDLATRNFVSVNSLDESGNEIINKIKTYDNTSDAIDKIFRVEFVNTLKKCLTKRQYEEVSLRYGFETGYEMKTSEISERMNISNTRAAKIDNTALQNLKLCKKIKDYYEN